MTALAWWENLPQPMTGVVELANHDPKTRGVIGAALMPASRYLLDDIALALGWIERLGSEPAADVLSDYHGYPVIGINLDVSADLLAEQLKSEVKGLARMAAATLTNAGTAA